MTREKVHNDSPLRRARLAAGMTQADLARATRRSPSTVQVAEWYRPSEDFARRCASVLGCRVADLIPDWGQP
jgi:transcriptional regulator with XRE-family HTH domain